MLSPARNGGRCIYCAFRTQQQWRQRIRLGNFRSLHTETQTPLRQETFRFTRDNPQKSKAVDSRQHRARRPLIQKRADDFGNGGRGARDGPSVVRREVSGRQTRRNAAGELEFGVFRRGETFEEALSSRLNVVREELKDAPLLEQLKKEREDEGGQAETFKKIWARFAKSILPEKGEKKAFFGVLPSDSGKEKIVRRLREAFKTRGNQGLDDRLKYEFYAHITGTRFTPSDIKNQQTLADLRYPSEWFPATRSIRRTIHLHVGPTNSGKTYHALQRLEAAETGVYAGPLRLLAHEVYTRMNAKGKACSLVTGEERRMADPETETLGQMSACTVEMMPLNKPLDVAVIDEIQMIGNAERGWAWTQALLGVKAKEVHLCGEERTVPLIREICASLGENVEIHRYTRLSPLEVAAESLDGDLKKLRKGDCVVSFSVMGIHALRAQIERATGRKVATVYGSLPPETRAQQARLFNDPENDYDYLVASDAVGMGLNLAIKRIIFESSAKFDGHQHRTLAVADIKQIAGRAGRYRVAQQATTTQDTSTQDLSAAKGEPTTSLSSTDEPSQETNTGYVTTLQKFDYPTILTAMSSDPVPITSAGLFPPAPILERFASYFPPGTPFSYILTRLHELSQMHTRFHLCGLKDQVWIADMIEPIQGLTITDRNIICSAPASGTDRSLWKTLMPAFAKCIADQRGGGVADIEELPLEVLEAEVSASREYLRELELLHKGVVCYLWLSYRFAGVFGERALAFHVKGLVEEKIETVLGRFSFSETTSRKVREKRERSLMMDLEGLIEGSEGDVGGGVREGGEVVKEIDREFSVGDDVEDEGRVALRLEDEALREQTSLTAGGDHFGGEEELGIEDPVEDEDEGGVGAFAERRRHLTRGEQYDEDDVGEMISEAVAAAEVKEEAVGAAGITRKQPFVGDSIPDLAVVDRLSVNPRSETEEALSPEMHPGRIEAPIMPETESEVPPVETQEAPPTVTEARAIEEDDSWAPSRTERSTEGQRREKERSGLPHKHLAHVGVNQSELERNVESRP